MICTSLMIMLALFAAVGPSVHATNCCFPDERYLLETVSGLKFDNGNVAAEHGFLAVDQVNGIQASKRDFTDLVTGSMSTVHYLQRFNRTHPNGKMWLITDGNCVVTESAENKWAYCIADDFVKLPSVTFGDGTDCQNNTLQRYEWKKPESKYDYEAFFTSNCIVKDASKISDDGKSGYVRIYANYCEITNDADFGDIFDIPASCNEDETVRKRQYEQKKFLEEHEFFF